MISMGSISPCNRARGILPTLCYLPVIPSITASELNELIESFIFVVENSQEEFGNSDESLHGFFNNFPFGSGSPFQFSRADLARKIFGLGHTTRPTARCPFKVKMPSAAIPAWKRNPTINTTWPGIGPMAACCHRSLSDRIGIG
jgi:hypothetical protein